MEIESISTADTYPIKLLGAINKLIYKVFPIHVSLSPTNNCNNSCSFCSCKNRDNSVLDYEDIERAIIKFYHLGCKTITITGGGEPTLHPDIKRIIRFINNLKIKIGLVTNGLLLNNISDILGMLSWCRISFPQEIKLKPDFSVINKVDIDWSFSFVVTSNWGEKENQEIRRVLGLYKVSHVRLIKDMFDNDMVLPMLPKLNKVLIQQKNYRKGTNPCFVSLLRPLLAADGFIYPCCGIQYASVIPARKFHKSMALCRINMVIDKWEQQSFFDGSKCKKCFYWQYNDLLGKIMKYKKITHLDFI